MLVDELLGTLFDGQSNPLAGPMAAWLASSRRFAAFVNANHTKIRKKLRTSREAESVRDLQLELETAYLLLRERSLSLVYEPVHPERGRGPDFAVTFTTSLTFMVEVTRLRTAGSGMPGAHPLGDRFINLVCSKLGQMQARHANVLVIGIETNPTAKDARESAVDEGKINAAMLRLQQRAEANDPAVVQRQGYLDRADFFRRYYRLSALLVRDNNLQAGELVVLWDNPQGKYPLPSRVRTAVLRSHDV